MTTYLDGLDSGLMGIKTAMSTTTQPPRAVPLHRFVPAQRSGKDWIVTCPYCHSQHFHYRLREAQAPCLLGWYYLRRQRSQNAKCSHLWGMTRGKLKPTKDMDEETDTQTTTDQPQRLATTLCSPSSFIAEVLRKDEAAVDELKTLVPEYTPPDEYAALHTRGKQALETLDEMTSLLRSAICICERQGTATNWEGFAASIRKLGLSGVTARTYRQANA